VDKAEFNFNQNLSHFSQDSWGIEYPEPTLMQTTINNAKFPYGVSNEKRNTRKAPAIIRSYKYILPLRKNYLN